MKITSGKLKSRKIETKLKGSKQPDYRPSSSKTRYAIFNILRSAKYLPENYLDDALVLDLYCGSGSFAFEAISHGAAHVTCVDESAEQLELVVKNAQNLGVEKQVDTLRCRAERLPNASRKFKVIYLDPPYGKNLVASTINNLVKCGWVGEHNLIIAEHDKYERLKLSDDFELLDCRVYGRTHLSIFTYREPNGQAESQ